MLTLKSTGKDVERERVDFRVYRGRCGRRKRVDYKVDRGQCGRRDDGKDVGRGSMLTLESTWEACGGGEEANEEDADIEPKSEMRTAVEPVGRALHLLQLEQSFVFS